jgi:acyl-coenzyme A thioesterase PaaI-like protein
MSALPPVASALDGAIGLTLEQARGGTATLRLDPGPAAVVEDESPFLHGGALATCVDTAAWYAAESASPGGWVVSSLHLDALRLARPEPHRVLARCLRAGRTLAVVDVEIAPAGETARIVAVGRATLVRTA